MLTQDRVKNETQSGKGVEGKTKPHRTEQNRTLIKK
jgi:hypothetical protein